MIKEYYPIIAYLTAMGLSQISKPFLHLKKDGFKLSHLFDSGGYPSSHTAGTVALAIAIGIKDGFSSSLFAIAFVLCVIVAFDSGNVRFYAGKNNKETTKLLNDLANKGIIKIEDYDTKLKEVLGHTKLEIISGIIVGILVDLLLLLII